METIEKLSREKLPKITVLAGEDLGQYSPVSYTHLVFNRGTFIKKIWSCIIKVIKN